MNEVGSTASREILILQDVLIWPLVQQLGEKNRKNQSVVVVGRGRVDKLMKKLGLVAHAYPGDSQQQKIL